MRANLEIIQDAFDGEYLRGFNRGLEVGRAERRPDK
jgi:hypothetical protein